MKKLLTVVIGGAITYAGLVAFEARVQAGDMGMEPAVCCNEGKECAGDLLCCPWAPLGAYPCSTHVGATKVDYCAAKCTQ
jgi:hypothetical protein